MLLESGLPARDAADVLCAEISSSAVAKAERVSMGLAPITVGLRRFPISNQSNMVASSDDAEFHRL